MSAPFLSKCPRPPLHMVSTPKSILDTHAFAPPRRRWRRCWMFSCFAFGAPRRAAHERGAKKREASARLPRTSWRKHTLQYGAKRACLFRKDACRSMTHHSNVGGNAMRVLVRPGFPSPAFSLFLCGPRRPTRGGKTTEMVIKKRIHVGLGESVQADKHARIG